MNTIFWRELGEYNCVSVDAIGQDEKYAHDCFDGTEREWRELLEDAGDNPEFFIVSSGLAGCYMRDNVSVYTSEKSALDAAKWEIEQWEDMEAEEAE